jgi:hypothetical protein
LPNVIESRPSDWSTKPGDATVKSRAMAEHWPCFWLKSQNLVMTPEPRLNLGLQVIEVAARRVERFALEW